MYIYSVTAKHGKSFTGFDVCSGTYVHMLVYYYCFVQSCHTYVMCVYFDITCSYIQSQKVHI